MPSLRWHFVMHQVLAMHAHVGPPVVQLLCVYDSLHHDCHMPVVHCPRLEAMPANSHLRALLHL